MVCASCLIKSSKSWKTWGLSEAANSNQYLWTVGLSVLKRTISTFDTAEDVVEAEVEEVAGPSARANGISHRIHGASVMSGPVSPVVS